jgi:hypothetical protein
VEGDGVEPRSKQRPDALQKFCPATPGSPLLPETTIQASLEDRLSPPAPRNDDFTVFVLLAFAAIADFGGIEGMKFKCKALIAFMSQPLHARGCDMEGFNSNFAKFPTKRDPQSSLAWRN